MTIANPATSLDVRTIQPRDRHPQIFARFDALQPGESFILVNDHDPRPLWYQFNAERSDQFTWTPLEQGPDVWQIEIKRTGA
jgi:uncharacterized protein (DUF2249 family)